MDVFWVASHIGYLGALQVVQVARVVFRRLQFLAVPRKGLVDESLNAIATVWPRAHELVLDLWCVRNTADAFITRPTHVRQPLK